MTPERWRQIEELYHSVRERGCEVLADVGSELRSEVEKLLAQDSGGKILDRPAADILQDSTLTAVVAPGSQMGPYRIVAPIGEGGMGTVYKARDTRLDRIVALKVSKEKFSERFEHEARAVAALNHPNICTLYDVGPDYLVMEYVEGSTLKGPLPVAQALKYAGQICEALDAAHQKGITHLDLKPGNILVTKSGVKLLDFGLARIEGGKNSTVTIGAVKGTPAYMAPEQWDGKPGDARSDIFAFGCVLYEMLTGKRAAAHRVVLGAADLENLVNTCLAPDPEDRWQSAKNLRQALMTIGIANSPARPSPWRERMGWITAAIGIVAALFFRLPPSWSPSRGEMVRLNINPPENAVFTPPSNATIGVPQIALSPDGHTLAFVANSMGARPQLWLRSLQTGIARPMAGTEGAELPFWSPDNRWVGFFAERKLKKIPLTDGPAEEITDVEEPRGGSWGPDNTILLGTGFEGINRVSSSPGGPVTHVTQRDASHQEGSHRFPMWLPDGKHFLYTVRSNVREQTGVYAGSLDGKTKKPVIRGNMTFALYEPSGYLLFMSGAGLMAQAFDADRLELRGQAFLVEAEVGRSTLGYGSFTVSGGGTLAYAGALAESGRLTWFDHGGNVQGSVGPPGYWEDFLLSRDQTRLAASLVDLTTGFPDIWLTDLALGNPAPFTFGPAINDAPLWSRDGTRIIFRTSRNGGLTEFFSKSAGGGVKEEIVLSEKVTRASGISSANLSLGDWSRDDQYLTFSAGEEAGLWLLPLAGNPKPVKFWEARGQQLHGNFSPDGHLIAYSSSESGQFEIHVLRFPLPDKQWNVSYAGGYEPRWRADGGELYYLSLDKKLMAVKVNPGPSFDPPRQLFQTRVPGGINGFRRHYVPSSDGKRFLINTQIGDPAPVSITVMLNWTAGLKK